MLSLRLLDTQSVDDALRYMCTKPHGYYIFMRLDKSKGGRYAVLLRDQDKTVRYNIRPNKDYNTYIMSTLEGGEKCYNSISELVEEWDSRNDYEMIRKMEMDEMSLKALSPRDLEASDVAGTRTRDSLDDVSSLLGRVHLSHQPQQSSSVYNKRCDVRPYQNSAHAQMDQGRQGNPLNHDFEEAKGAYTKTLNYYEVFYKNDHYEVDYEDDDDDDDCYNVKDVNRRNVDFSSIGKIKR